MDILVTGGCGVIGTRLAARLRKLGHTVHIIDLMMNKEENYSMTDITRYEELHPVFQKKIDMVVHLAATVGRYNGELYGLRCIDTNLRGTHNIINKCIEKDIPLIFASTSEVYGDLEVPLTEDLPGLRPLNIYGLTKLQAEGIIDHYARQHGLRYMIYRIFNCYGPGEYPNYFRSIITNFIYSITHDLKINVHRNCSRSWCFIDDVVDGFVAGLDGFRSGETYNLGTYESITVEDLAKMICRMAGKPEDLIEYSDRGRLDVRIKQPVLEKMKRDLGFTAKTSFEEGMKMTMEWHREIYGKGFILAEPIYDRLIKI